MLDFLRTALSRARSALRLDRADDDFRQELASHLEALTEENIPRGLAPDEAPAAGTRAPGRHGQAA